MKQEREEEDERRVRWHVKQERAQLLGRRRRMSGGFMERGLAYQAGAQGDRRSVTDAGGGGAAVAV